MLSGGKRDRVAAPPQRQRRRGRRRARLEPALVARGPRALRRRPRHAGPRLEVARPGRTAPRYGHCDVGPSQWMGRCQVWSVPMVNMFEHICMF